MNARTGKTIIDGMSALKNSKDRRQVAKMDGVYFSAPKGGAK